MDSNIKIITSVILFIIIIIRLQEDVLTEKKETEGAHVNGTFAMQEQEEDTRINHSITNTPV